MTLEKERSIVLVEDSEEDFATFRRAMRACAPDAKIVRYSEGESFLNDLRQEGFPRSHMVVVLDLNLPALSGEAVLRELREDPELHGLPVVILTTSSNPRDIRRCYELGIGGYIVKPSDFKLYCDRIESLTEYWLRTVHLP